MKKKIRRSHSMGTGSAIALSVGALIVVGTVASAAVAIAGLSTPRSSSKELWDSCDQNHRRDIERHERMRQNFHEVEDAELV